MASYAVTLNRDQQWFFVGVGAAQVLVLGMIWRTAPTAITPAVGCGLAALMVWRGLQPQWSEWRGLGWLVLLVASAWWCREADVHFGPIFYRLGQRVAAFDGVVLAASLLTLRAEAPQRLALSGLSLQLVPFLFRWVTAPQDPPLELLVPILLTLTAMESASRGVLTRSQVLPMLCAGARWSFFAPKNDLQLLFIPWIDVAVAVPWLLGVRLELSNPPWLRQWLLSALLCATLLFVGFLVVATSWAWMELFWAELLVTVLALSTALRGELRGLRLVFLLLLSLALAEAAGLLLFEPGMTGLLRLMFSADAVVVGVRAVVSELERAIR